MASCQYCGTGFESGKFCPACGRPVARPANETRDPLLGAVIDGLRLESVLGRGMTGCVYRATQLALERPLAVKVPTVALASDTIAVKRFRREALALARISHPGVVGVHAVGDLPDGRPYLAIEFLDGQALEVALTGPLPVPRAVDLSLQIAEALAEVHAHDIVHRDLKPDNVMLVKPQVGGERAVLIDFGLAKPVANPDATRLTAGGGLVGTPHYMAPEQVQGDELDGRADVYALGATLYRMLTGNVPFDGTGVEVVVAHLARSVQPVRALAPEVSIELEAIVMKCLAKRVSDRWPTASELARALAEVETGPARTPRAKRVSAPPPVAVSATTGSSSARRRAAAAAANVADDATSSTAYGARGGGGSTRSRIGRPARAQPEPPDEWPDGRASAHGRSVTRPAEPSRGGGGRGGWIAALVAAAAVATVTVLAVMGGRDKATAAPGTVDPPGTGAITGSGSGSADPIPPGPTRSLIVDDGGLSMQVAVPEVIAVGAPVRFALEIWDDQGTPVDASQIVVTVEADDGSSHGFAATRAGLGRSVYAFTTRFEAVGHYKLRVFPPVGDATFVVDIDVVPA